eukprot:480523-Pleurochrysis_carterae.AAC.2
MPNWASWTVGWVDPMPSPLRDEASGRLVLHPLRPRSPRSAPRLRGMAGGENIALARPLAGSAIARARSQEYEATFLIVHR